jgi:hypothetical protein
MFLPKSITHLNTRPPPITENFSMDKQYGKKKCNITIELPHLENPSTSVDLVADSMGSVPDYRGAMSGDL